MLPLSRIVSQRSPWQMYTLATRSTRLFGVGHVSCCTRIKLIAGLTRFTGAWSMAYHRPIAFLYSIGAENRLVLVISHL